MSPWGRGEALGPVTTHVRNLQYLQHAQAHGHLFCMNPHARYADYYERALYNQILASQNPADG